MRVPLSIDGAPPELYTITFQDKDIGGEMVSSAEFDTTTAVLLLHLPSGNTVTIHTNAEED